MSQEKICKKAADTLIQRTGTKLQQDDSIQILTKNCTDQRNDPENYKKFKEPRFGDCCTELERATTYHGFSSQLANMSSLTPEQIRAALSISELPGISKVGPVSVRRQAKTAEQNPRASKLHQNREEYAGLLHKYIQPSMDELTQKTMRAKIVRASEADKRTIDDHGATAMGFTREDFLKNLMEVHDKFEAKEQGSGSTGAGSTGAGSTGAGSTGAKGGKRKTRKSHKAKGKSHKAKGKSHKAKGKSHKAKGKTHKAKGKSHKAKGKTHKAKGKRKTRKH